MKIWEIAQHSRQINKIRHQLGDFHSPPDLIKKPKYMRTAVFERRIRRLKRHERERAEKFRLGGLKWVDRRYKV